MVVFAKEVCRRLPLGEAVLRLFDFVCQEDFLKEVFSRYRGGSYEKKLSFPVFVQLIADALLEHGGSGRKGFVRAKENGELNTSIRAVYGKLGRVPLSLSMGLLGDATARMAALYPESIRRWAPPWSLYGMEVLYHDGKKLKHVAKRLKVLRKLKGHVLGGKLVVTQLYSTGMAIAMGASPDGEAGDTPLMPELLKQVRRLVRGPRLHVADRMFCDLLQPTRFTEDPQDHFLIRWNRKVHFHRDPSREVRSGEDRYGRKYQEDWGWIGGPENPRRRYVRRIWLMRPGKEEDVILLSDLLDSDQYPADDLLEVYLERWGIERMFQKVTEVFFLKTLIGGTPDATVFQASFCFLLYNMIQVVRAYIAEGQSLEVKEISSENLFYDVHRQLVAWNEMLTTPQTVQLLSTTWTAAQLAHRLRALLHPQWSECWRKAPSNTHKSSPAKEKKYLEGGHTSVYRLMCKARTAA